MKLPRFVCLFLLISVSGLISFVQAKGQVWSLTTEAVSPPFAAQENSVYKANELGIQFVVPAGWQVKKDPNGTVTVSKKDGDGYVVLAFSSFAPDASTLTSDALFKAFAEGIFSNAKKDFGSEFKTGEIGTAPQNGMTMTMQSFSGKQDGADISGVVIVLNATKPVGLYMQATTKLSDSLGKESELLFKSIKKLE
jgi:hypothetical protein